MKDTQTVGPTGDAPAPAKPLTDGKLPVLIAVRNPNVWYETTEALHDVTYDLRRGEILAFIGRSGCGKTIAPKYLTGCRMRCLASGLKGQSG